MRPPVPLDAVLVLALALPLLGCPEGTGDFAPGGKAAGLLRPAEKGAAPAVAPPRDDEEDPALPRGHPQIPGAAPPSQELLAKVDAMKKEIDARPKTIEIMISLGNLYYENQRYTDAIDWYRQAIEAAEPGWRSYSALPEKARSGGPSPQARARCQRTESRQHEQLSAEAQAYERAGAPADAAACWKAALQPVVDARVRRANAFLLAGNSDQAIAEHEANLARDPRNPDSLYYLGAILADDEGASVARLRRAEGAWRRYLALGTGGERARAARQGIDKLEERIRNGGKMPPPLAQAGAAAGPGAVSQGAAEAIAGMDTKDPAFWKAADEQVAQGERFLAEGNPEQAKEYMKSLMPVMMMKGQDAPPGLFQRVLNGMGYAFIALGNREMGGRLLRMVLDKDPGNATARAGLEALSQGRAPPRYQAPSRPAGPAVAAAERKPPPAEPQVPAVPAAAASRNLRSVAAQGDEAYKRGDYARAASLWRQVLDADPYLAGELRLRGRIADAEKAQRK